MVDDDPDDKPYDMSQAAPKCPQCQAVLAHAFAECPGCGFQKPTEPQPEGFEPLKHAWETPPSLYTRVVAFLAYLLVLTALAGLALLEDVTPAQLVLPLAFFSFLAAFAIGTFDRVDLSRNYFGKLALSKTWRICFIPCKPAKIALRDCEAVATSASAERVLFDWLILVWLLSLFILPGVLWWIYVFSKPTHQVALTKAHGQVSTILYQGPNEEHAIDIAEMVSEVCRLRWRRNY